ncbi:chemotaxis protein histidine kinase CheA [Methylopila capsulata]|uniref:Chemotaxis protein histidine kinase CheA n=1 Tax=Methylopila capsulata TaxID=61654 RepID=A0A9W6IRX7_9HYPH|nr:Hpt domain-containing protein [Methylopila capsulata]MBM7850092.1 chemotaxis protein histidine kinase CheA [Methylopila capsulata]GLK55383.1 hypothetical protein GCM10008170_14020 [Methylopila capsulata]
MADGEAERRAKITAAVEAVRARFLVSFEDKLAELGNLAAAAAAGDDEARIALQRGLHTIAGTAATLGLHDLGAEARVLEASIERGESPTAEDLRQKLRTPDD